MPRQQYRKFHRFQFQIVPDLEYEFETDVYLGWIVEGEWSPISFEFFDPYNLHFFNLDSTSPRYPVVGEVFAFEKLPYFAKHSISVTVERKLKDVSQRNGNITLICIKAH